MEDCVVKENALPNEHDNLIEGDSAANFQKFIFDLFEKNGILNDLRAYLRGHIIDVLRSARTGEPPKCQKNFIQRLELAQQGMNMLIAEYLLRMDFSYTLSVFVSEIPLGNMVFGFAKNLMQESSTNLKNLKFEDSDVWSILNYLGIKCDSECATNILKIYKKNDTPLVMSMLKCTLGEPLNPITGNASDTSSSSDKSMGSISKILNADKVASAHEKCRHNVVCKICYPKMKRMKKKYKDKKKHIVKNVKPMVSNEPNVKLLMKNMGEMEQTLVNEMFEQLKSVYETEVNMMRREEESKVKQSFAKQTLKMQQQMMEETFKVREEKLEKKMQEKKKFLWILARALRDQHRQMARAMHAVRFETERLTAKEESLKTQLSEAEEILRSRGEEMRSQIAGELLLLEDHLACMKKERENIDKERSELEKLKNTNNNIKIQEDDNLHTHYDLLKNEMGLLKKYLETTKLEPKCVIERSTLTDLSDVTSKLNVVLNNEQDAERSPMKSESVDRMKAANKVINDLKKQKIVNFASVSPSKIDCESCRRSHTSSEGIAIKDRKDTELERLREENERLRIFATQQREHIDEISSHHARLQAELTAARLQLEPTPSRPRTAPSTYPDISRYGVDQSHSARSVGWSKGAGEEISMFANAQPRIMLPGDTLPFVGVLRDKHNDKRRYMINQWRALRRRTSPIIATKVRGESSVQRNKSPTGRPTSPVPQREAPPVIILGETEHPQSYNNSSSRDQSRTSNFPETVLPKREERRERSPKSVLKEVREKLKNYEKDHPLASTRDKSPNSVLREAKLRLRKLEIEAEAVEQSYLEFRRRQHQGKEREDIDDVMVSSSQYKPEEVRQVNELRFLSNGTSSPFAKKDSTRNFLRTTYEAKVITSPHFKSRVATQANVDQMLVRIDNIQNKVKQSEERRDYYLETPLKEFRKLYYSQRSPIGSPVSEKSLKNKQSMQKSEDILQKTEDILDENKDANKNSLDANKKDSIKDCESVEKKTPRKTREELELLKEAILAKYNLKAKDKSDEEVPIEDKSKNVEEDKIETDTQNEIKEIDQSNNEPNTSQLVLVVESTTETKEINLPDIETQREKVPAQMTIIVSPKICDDSSSLNSAEKSVEQARSTRNDAFNAIFHSDTSKEQSSIEMELNIPKDIEGTSDIEKGNDDYPDDFSADVDNYNSRSDYETHSPISQLKNSEDDNFWDTN